MKLVVAVISLVLGAIAQELPDSKGRDFWFCFMPNYHNLGITNANAREQDSVFVFVAADKPTTVTLEFTPYDGRPPQQIVQRIEDPNHMLIIGMGFWGVELIGINGGGVMVQPQSRHTQRPVPCSFHLTSDEDVTVYALAHADKTSDAFLVLPTDALGKDYFIMSYNADPYRINGSYSYPSTPSQFAIVATDDSTMVEITRLTAPTVDGPVSQVQLQRGEVYLIQSQTSSDAYDLTGSRVRANRPIAVFGGHQRVRLPLSDRSRGGGTYISSRDCLIEQMPSVNTWGRSILLVPYPDPPGDQKRSTDRYRILAARDSTVVYRDSVPLVVLNEGQFYEGELKEAATLQANRPILVAQFRRTSSSNVQNPYDSYDLGDPFMIVLPPTEQFLSNYRVVCPRIYEDSAITSLYSVKREVYKYHSVTIIAPDSAKATVRVDGRIVPEHLFVPIPKSSYVYAWYRLDAGVHTISADVPIGIHIYGYGFADSYGYVGGMAFRRFDFDPPRIVGTTPCPPYRIVVYDSLPMDSRVDVVRVLEDSTSNVEWRIERNSMLPVDSVEVYVALRDPYEDGLVTVLAQDAEQFVTVKRFHLPGMTLRGISPDATVERLPLRFTYRTSTQRTWCFPVRLVNTGSFPQTVLRAFSAHGIVSDVILPAVLSRADTLYLNVCYRAEQSISIEDTLWIDTPCGRYTAATFTIEFVVDTLPPRVLRTQRPCPEVHILSISEPGLSESGIATFEVLDSVNVQVELLGDGENAYWIADELTLRISQRDWRLDSYYRLVVTDSSGNASIASGEFEGHTVMITNRDSLAPLQRFTGVSNSFLCDTIELYNFGTYPKRFDRITVRGIEFAPPPSFMPLVIPAGTRVRVPFCALLPPYRSEIENVYRDTVELTVGCYTRRMPVEISITMPSYTAESSCGVSISTPETARGQVMIRDGSGIDVYLPATADWKISLYASSGHLLWNTRADGSHVRIEMDRFPPGAYWIVGTCAEAFLRVPLLWTGQ